MKLHAISATVQHFSALFHNGYNYFNVFTLQQEMVMPYVAALADFREKVRDVAREEKGTCCHCHSDRTNQHVYCILKEEYEFIMV